VNAGSRAVLARTLALTQGAVMLVTGAWPLLDMRSFEWVTGPKRDDWLVRTVGGLAIAIGAGLLWRSDEPRAARPFGIAAAATFAAADLIGVGSGRLRRVYLLDAVMEGAFLAGWLLTASRRRPGSSARPVGVPVARPARAPDLAVIRRAVGDRQAEATRAAQLAWPKGGAPDAVTEALHRLAEANEQLAFAAEGADLDDLRELVATTTEDAAAVHEAANLISS
jgi:hypothetical protein